FALELAQKRCLRLGFIETEADGLLLLEDNGQRIVPVLRIVDLDMRPDADFDAAAASPEVALAGEFGVQCELEIGQAIQRNIGQHELLAGGGDEFGSVGDAIGFGDEPAGYWVAV